MALREERTEGLTIKQNMLWNSFGSLISLGCQWVITVLVARLANGYDSAGVYSLAMSVYGIFTPLAQYRLYTYQVSDVKGEYTIGEYLSFRLISTAAALVLTIAYSLVTCSFSTIPAILLYGLYKTAGLIIDVFHGADQVHHRMDYIGKSLAFQGILSLLAFVILFTTTSSLEVALIGMILATCCVGFFYDYPRTVKLERFNIGITFDRAKKLAMGCASIVIAGIACSAAPSIPRQYVSATLGNAALGAYASMAAPVAIIQMGVCYIYNPLLSYFSESYLGKDYKRFSQLFLITILGTALIGVVCGALLNTLGARFLIFVYGDSISSYLYLMRPLVFLAILTGLMWFVNDLLIAIRSFRATLVGSILALLISMVITIPTVTIFGLDGITIASALACFAGVVYMIAALACRAKAHFVGSSVD